MKEEISTLEQRETWEYVLLSRNTNIIGTHFVYKSKQELGQTTRLKLHLVVQGFVQHEGVDFYSNDLFAPVARISLM